MNLTDEQIMAFVDGTLNPAKSKIILDKINNDPSAVEKLKNYERSKQLLNKEFSHLKNEVPPAFLINTVRNHFVKKNNVINLFSSMPLQSMAASLFIGLFIGLFIMKYSTDTGDTLLFDDRPKQVNSTSDKNDNSLKIPATPPKFNSKNMMQLQLISALGKQLNKEPDANSYNVTLNENNYQLTVSTTFFDSINNKCKILNAKITELRYISACMNKEGEWIIEVAE